MKTKHILLALFVMLFCVALVAQEAPVVEDTTVKITPGRIIQDSGYWGYAIILVFVIGLVYGIVRYVQLYQREKVDAQKLYLKLKGYIKNDQIEEATKIAESFKSTTLGFIFWSGLKAFGDMRKANKTG